MTEVTGYDLLFIFSVKSLGSSPYLHPAHLKGWQTSAEVRPLPSSSTSPPFFPERGNDASPHAAGHSPHVSPPPAGQHGPTVLSPAQGQGRPLDLLGSLQTQAARYFKLGTLSSWNSFCVTLSRLLLLSGIQDSRLSNGSRDTVLGFPLSMVGVGVRKTILEEEVALGKLFRSLAASQPVSTSCSSEEGSPPESAGTLSRAASQAGWD